MKFIPFLLVAVCPVLALHAGPSPYAGEQTRQIKALSEGEVSSLLNGHGMGFARAAELNRYPGPRHVLDLADDLKLTPAQTAKLTTVFETMKAAALPLGREVVAREIELDRLFTSKQASPDTVLALTHEIGRLQGGLRAVHLNAHVATVGILQAGQIARYEELRGYTTAAPAAHDPANHQGHQP